MGVDSLIKFLQPIIKKEHLSSFRNQTAAIDMNSWIYRAINKENQIGKTTRKKKKSLSSF